MPNSFWKVEYYRSERGISPPKEFIDGLPATLRAKIAVHLKLLQEFGPELRMPHAKQLIGHKPLWELRPMPARLIYVAFKDQTFVVLHAFQKKKNQTDAREIKVAENRLKELQEKEK